MFLDGPLSKARYEVINAIRRLGERPRDDGEIKLLKARTRSVIDLVLYFEDLLEGNDDSGLTVEEKLPELGCTFPFSYYSCSPRRVSLGTPKARARARTVPSLSYRG